MRSGMRSQPGSLDARRTPAAWRAGRQGDQRWPALPRVDRDCLDWQTPRRWPSSAAGSNCPASGTTSAPTTTRRYAHSASKRRIEGSTGPPTTTGQSESRGSESVSPRGRNQAGRITTSRVLRSRSTASSGDPGLGSRPLLLRGVGRLSLGAAAGASLSLALTRSPGTRPARLRTHS
jgi:hypothetical protein